MAASLTLPGRFHAFLQEQSLIARGDRIVVAVSGGVDSVVLLHLLAGERNKWEADLLVAHYNHQLRGEEADADEEFTRRLAARYDLAFVAGRGPVERIAATRGKGLEEAARHLRYRFLEETRRVHGYARIATGHNADDNCETVLLNLFRGSGVRGLAGIPVKRNEGTIVRPLLFATRDDIAAFARAEELSHRDDASNATDGNARNILRHHVVPVVRSRIQPDVAHTMQRTSALLRELDEYLTFAARTGLDQDLTRRTGEEVHLPLSLLSRFPTVIRQYMVMQIAGSCAGTTLSHERVDAVLSLQSSQPGTAIELGGEWQVCRTRDGLHFIRSEGPQPFAIAVEAGVTYDAGDGSFSFRPVGREDYRPDPAGDVEFVDADRTGSTGLTLRSWQQGDRFVPLGMKGEKKVSDFFADTGVPAYARGRHPVLLDAQGQIIWLCGLRIDDRFRITSSTSRVLRLQFQRRTRPGHGQNTHRER